MKTAPSVQQQNACEGSLYFPVTLTTAFVHCTKRVQGDLDIGACSDHKSLLDSALGQIAKLDSDRLNKYAEYSIVPELGQFARAFMGMQFSCDVTFDLSSEVQTKIPLIVSRNIISHLETVHE
jgi:hypothetical protein